MTSQRIARHCLFVSLLCLVVWAVPATAGPKNIIVFIGDGMGPEHVRAAGIYANGAAGAFPFELFPFQGQLTTYAANNAITDSAAAGSALATGYKVNTGVISMAYPANSAYPVQGSEMLTLLEYFKASGKSTGLVSTAYLTDATPAAFGAHESVRSNTAQIAADFYTQTRPNVLLGGGGNGQSAAAAQAAGYTVVTDRAGLLGVTGTATYLSGQFGSSDFPYFYDVYSSTYPRLAEMTAAALQILDNDADGLFLVVESGRIDDAASANPNDLVRMIPEVSELSAAVQAAMDWAAGRNDTLIVVVADHETGGLSVATNNGAGVYPTVSWAGTVHTTANVPAYAWGVNAGFISGVLDNTNLFGIATADTVVLTAPAEGAVEREPTVTFSCSVVSDRQLQDATLYLSQGAATTKTVSFSGPGDTDDTQLYGTNDPSTTAAEGPDTNAGGAASINIDSLDPHAHAVIKFPSLIGNGTNQVAMGSTITSATLKVYCTNIGNTLKLYRLKDSWVEGQATWNQRAAGVAWTGGPGVGTNSYEGAAIDGACSAIGWRTIDVTRIVQEWCDGSGNFGFVILDSGSDGIDIDSSESVNPPVLTVTSESSLLFVETQAISGTSATVSFSPVAVTDATDYTWNCMVRTADGQSTWAPQAGHFRADTQMPNLPALVAPANGALVGTMAPSLQAAVSDPQGDPLTVSFFGRAVPQPQDFFTVVVLPDTQSYSLSSPATFTAQTQWIVNNKASHNIVFVTHEGDIVENWDNTAQWANANTSMSLLDGVVPYGILPGNHDKLTDTLTGTYPDYPYDSSYYNQNFPATRYEGQSWYGGHYPESGNNNSFQLFSAAGDDYLILHLEDTPNTATIAWAHSVLSSHPNRKAIVTVHGYIDASGNYLGKYGLSTQYIWDDLIAPSSNVVMVLCSHYTGEFMRSKPATDGHTVYEIMADYHANGWLRILRFVPAEDKVYVNTYSPTLGTFETDSNSRFTLNVPLNEFKPLGSAAAASGQTASFVWPGLSLGKKYEWYARAADSGGRLRDGATGNFSVTTVDVIPPVITEVTAINVTETTATITWTTDEAAGSVVRYGTATDLWSSVTAPQLTTSHSMTLSGLMAGTDYLFEVESTDAAVNTTTDNNGNLYYAFTTIALDTVAPTIIPDQANPGIGTTGEAVTIRATITDDRGVTGASIRYTPIDGSETTTGLTYQAGDNIWLGTIPVAVDRVGTIVYSITAQDAANNSSNSIPYSITISDNDPPTWGQLGANLVATAESGGSVTLTWSAASDNIAVEGYEVYQDGLLINPETLVTERVYTDVLAHGSYSYTVRAVDSVSEVKNRSEPSNPASVMIDLTPPTISGVTTSAVTDRSATITWTTNEPATSVVRYWVGTLSVEVQDPDINNQKTDHSVELMGLAPNTTYSYEVKSADAMGNLATASGPSFQTLLLDTDAPSINGATEDVPMATTGEGATIAATITDFVGVAGASVTYTPIGGTETTIPMVEGASYQWTAVVPVAISSIGTIPYFITAQDGSGNRSRSPATGSYAITVSDNDAPSAVADLVATAAAGGNVQLSWSEVTDNIGVAIYRVYRNGNLLTTVTELAFNDSPGPDGTYLYNVTAIDAAVNESAASNIAEVLTDGTGPVISQTASAPAAFSATITWTTSEPGTSVVRYWTGIASPMEVSDAAWVINHSVVLTGLTAATRYSYEVGSADALGNAATVSGQPFITLTPAPQTLFSDGFESNNLTAGGWTISGTVVASTTAASSGTYGARLRSTAWMQKTLSTEGMKDIRVQYARKTAALDSGEYLYVEWSADGTVWNALESTTATSWGAQNLLCGSGAENQPGFRLRFRTNANRTDEYGYVDAVVIIGTSMGPVNHEPVVSISSPANGAVIVSGAMVNFAATAGDDEDGDLTGAIQWHSSIDGLIGTGGNLSRTLSDGDHTITASATDSGSVSGSASISITVGSVARKVHAESIGMSIAQSSRSWKATAAVLVHDQAGAVKAGARVTGNWYLSTTLIQTGAAGTTGTNGSVSIVSPTKSASRGAVFKFVITSIALTGYEYDSTQGVTQGTIAVP